MHAERLVRVERRTGRLRVLGDQLEVRHAVIVATMNATRNGAQAAPPTSPATWPVSAYTPVPRMSPMMNSRSSLGPITRNRSGSSALCRSCPWAGWCSRWLPGVRGIRCRHRGSDRGKLGSRWPTSAEEDLGLAVLPGCHQLELAGALDELAPARCWRRAAPPWCRSRRRRPRRWRAARSGWPATGRTPWAYRRAGCGRARRRGPPRRCAPRSRWPAGRRCRRGARDRRRHARGRPGSCRRRPSGPRPRRPR